jgi:hypothetical protein
MPERSLNTERFIATLMVMATLWSGCESALDEVDSAPPEAETSEVLGDTYTEGLEKRGDAELIRVALTTSTPTLKYAGAYTWLISISDDEGGAITGAEVVAVPTMPTHGHGTFPTMTLGDEVDPGRYQLVDMDLFMAGLWRIAIEVQWGEGAVDTVQYEFDLEG